MKSLLPISILLFTFNSFAEINESCKNKEVKAYIKSSCIYCHKLINVLKKYDIKHEITELSSKAIIASWLINTTGSNKVPYVYLDNKYIGGYSDYIRICEINE